MCGLRGKGPGHPPADQGQHPRYSLHEVLLEAVSDPHPLPSPHPPSPDLSLREIVIQMRCSCRHCMCLVCFRNMCRVKLDNNSFGNFDGFGYSVCCPGTGENAVNTALHHNDVIFFPGLGADCKDVPILDPHHFKIVDENPAMDGTFVGPSPLFFLLYSPIQFILSLLRLISISSAVQEVQRQIVGQLSSVWRRHSVCL